MKPQESTQNHNTIASEKLVQIYNRLAGEEMAARGKKVSGGQVAGEKTATSKKRGGRSQIGFG